MIYLWLYKMYLFNLLKKYLALAEAGGSLKTPNDERDERPHPSQEDPPLAFDQLYSSSGIPGCIC